MKYAAIIDKVHEVTLWGKASFDFWRNFLKGCDLFPYNDNDNAVVVISAINSKFKGIKFSELSVSIKVSYSENGSTDDGFYLIRAYNSIRFFAWVERNIFKTPYYTGKIILNNAVPAKLELTSGGTKRLEFEMENNNACMEEKFEQLEFKVSLPDNGERKYFYASIEGITETYNFSRGDIFKIADNAGGVWEMLKESGFLPLTWYIRKSAIHKKSKTFKR